MDYYNNYKLLLLLQIKMLLQEVSVAVAVLTGAAEAAIKGHGRRGSGH